MGFKKTNFFKLLDNIAITGVTVYTSATQNIQNLDNLFLQVRFSGTPTGSLDVQASADGILWDSFVFAPALAQPAGAPLAYGVSMQQIPAAFFRVVYSNTAGSGHLTVNYFVKDLN